PRHRAHAARAHHRQGQARAHPALRGATQVNRAAKVGDLVELMEAWAPLSYAEPWDNVGLLLGDRASALSGVLACIDLSREVVQEATARDCQAVVAYHPPIF